MTTEQYSIGYDEGYQAGWNAAMDTSLPASKPWEGLTDDDLDDIATAAKRGNLHDLRLAIEAKLKEKNA